MILRNTDLSLILYFSGFQPWLTFHFCERIKKKKQKSHHAYTPRPQNNQIRRSSIWDATTGAFSSILGDSWLAFPGDTVCWVVRHQIASPSLKFLIQQVCLGQGPPARSSNKCPGWFLSWGLGNSWVRDFHLQHVCANGPLDQSFRDPIPCITWAGLSPRDRGKSLLLKTTVPR